MANELTMRDAVREIIEPWDKTLDDVKDVFPNGAVPTHLYILFNDGTYAEVEFTYPVQA